MLELLNIVRHFESFAQNAKIPHVDFGVVAPEIHRDLFSNGCEFPLSFGGKSGKIRLARGEQSYLIYASNHSSSPLDR